MEIRKDGNDNPVCEIAKETQMYRRVFWTLWERAEPLPNALGHQEVKFFPLSYVKRITSPGLMHGTGCSGLVCWDDPEG